MRDVYVIKEQRDKLKKMINKMTCRLEDMKVDYGNTLDMERDRRKLYFAISSLRSRYTDQVKALEYVLNEDSEMNVQYSKYLENVSEFLI